MPLNPPTLAAAFLAPNLLATGNIGSAMPKLALGVSIGVCRYLTVQAKVSTTDVGFLGVGTSVFPLIVPQPMLQVAFLASFSAAQVLGALAPLLITGLATGLTTGFAATALVQTNHPSVGAGTGLARLSAPSAVPAMLFGFSSVGMVGDGPQKIARAIGLGLDTTFASFYLPVPIVGAPSTSSGAGIGFGSVI